MGGSAPLQAHQGTSHFPPKEKSRIAAYYRDCKLLRSKALAREAAGAGLTQRAALPPSQAAGGCRRAQAPAKAAECAAGVHVAESKAATAAIVQQAAAATSEACHKSKPPLTF